MSDDYEQNICGVGFEGRGGERSFDGDGDGDMPFDFGLSKKTGPVAECRLRLQWRWGVMGHTQARFGGKSHSLALLGRGGPFGQ